MKKYLLRFRKGNKDSEYSFRAIKRGRKKVETRAASERYRRIQSGDVLVFVCGREKVEKLVKRLRVFKSIPAMLRVYRVKDIMPDRDSPRELKAAYESYHGYREKIKKFGLVAFELA